jgi:hypothetical protein
MKIPYISFGRIHPFSQQNKSYVIFELCNVVKDWLFLIYHWEALPQYELLAEGSSE